MAEKDDTEHKTSYMAVGMALGMSLGMLFDNLVMGNGNRYVIGSNS